MGKLLAGDEYFDSIGAVKDFWLSKEREKYTYKDNLVEVYRNNNLFLQDKSTIVINIDNSKTRVDILWKDDNYRELGLFGTYSAAYCKMEFIPKGKYLLIHSDNNIDVLVY